MQILTNPNPFLRKKAKPIKSVTKTLLSEISEMIKVLKKTTDPKGVGLAATQVGLDKRLFILLDDNKPRIFINPEITKVSHITFSQVYKDDEDMWMEGCLSIPKIWGFVDRPHKVTLKFQTLDGESKLVEKEEEFEGIESAFVQHERDHLDGILFTDHVLKQNGQLYQEIKGKFHPIEL
jgi:peptide deformylase